MAINKETQYTAIYFRENEVEDKQRAYFALLDIDANFSRLVQLLLISAYKVAKFIFKADMNYRHFKWGIIIQSRKTGEKTEFFGDE